MRGERESQGSFLCVVSLESKVPRRHPLRRIKSVADEVLASMSDAFDQLYSHTGRPSVPPERLLKASLLMALYSIPSERMLCEQIDYNLLFRWFLDLDIDDTVFDASTFSKNRERLMKHDTAGEFLQRIVEFARAKKLLSDEHFSVDGTLIEAWASMKSFRPKDDDDDHDSNGWANFKGQKRRNDTHESKTDPEAKLIRKGRGQEAKLCFMGHALMDNRNGLVVGVAVTEANGRAEREAALALLDATATQTKRTLGADKGYDTRDFVSACEERGVVPHIASKARYSAMPHHITQTDGYAMSQNVRRRIEGIFGWMKVVACFRRTRFKGRRRTQLAAELNAAAYNLLRIANLQPA